MQVLAQLLIACNMVTQEQERVRVRVNCTASDRKLGEGLGMRLPRCCAKSFTVQDTFWPVPGLVTSRQMHWGDQMRTAVFCTECMQSDG